MFTFAKTPGAQGAATLTALAICGNYATAGGAAMPRIERHRVGVVAIGIDADKVYDACRPNQRRLVDLALEGLLSPALNCGLPGRRNPMRSWPSSRRIVTGWSSGEFR